MTVNVVIDLAAPADIPGLLALQEPNLPEHGGSLVGAADRRMVRAHYG